MKNRALMLIFITIIGLGLPGCAIDYFLGGGYGYDKLEKQANEIRAKMDAEPKLFAKFDIMSAKKEQAGNKTEYILDEELASEIFRRRNINGVWVRRPLKPFSEQLIYHALEKIKLSKLSYVITQEEYSQAVKAPAGLWHDKILKIVEPEVKTWVKENYPNLAANADFFAYNQKIYIYKVSKNRLTIWEEKPINMNTFKKDYLAYYKARYMAADKMLAGKYYSKFRTGYGSVLGMMDVINTFEEFIGSSYRATGVISAKMIEQNVCECIVNMDGGSYGGQGKMLVRTKIDANGKPLFYERIPA